MAQTGDDGLVQGLPEGGSADEGNEAFRLLRFSHIFASAVREMLEVKPLREASPSPLTLSQFHLLMLMSLNGSHQVGEVADFLGVSPPAASKTIDKLERLGLVVRAPSRGDRRATLLSVSPEGRRLVERCVKLKTGRMSPLLKGFLPVEIEQFVRFLERSSMLLLDFEPSGHGFCLRCAAYIDTGCPVGDIRGGCPHRKGRESGAAGVGTEEVS